MAQTKRRRRVRKAPTPPPPDRLALSAEEAAYVLGCSVPQVWNLLRVEALPRMRIGRQTRIGRAAINEFIAAGGVAVVTTRKPSTGKTQEKAAG